MRIGKYRRMANPSLKCDPYQDSHHFYSHQSEMPPHDKAAPHVKVLNISGFSFSNLLHMSCCTPPIGSNLTRNHPLQIWMLRIHFIVV